MKVTILWILCIVPGFVFSISCNKRKCEEALFVTNSSVVVTFKDKESGKYLYPLSNPLYNRDSLKIYNQNGLRLLLLYHENLIPNTYNTYWSISFGPVFDMQTDSASFKTELCKNFIIKYNATETDTVNVCFKSKETKCGSVFESLKVFHKNQLIGSNSGHTGILVDINKD